MFDTPPAALAKRDRAWRHLRQSHSDGVHHEVLCRTDASCTAYDRVLSAQLDLVERALRLPPGLRDEVADALDAPGRAPLRRLVATAEVGAQDCPTQPIPA